MADNQELEAKLVALEAVLKTTVLPLWRFLLSAEVKELHIDALEELARNADDFYTNRGFSHLIAEELRRWMGILGEVSQVPVTMLPNLLNHDWHSG